MAPATSQTTETHPKPFDASTTSSPTASSCCSVLPLSPITSSASSSSRVLAVPSRTFTHPDNQEPQATSIMSVAEPLVLPDGRFGCPKCPRCSFNTLAKATLVSTTALSSFTNPAFSENTCISINTLTSALLKAAPGATTLTKTCSDIGGGIILECRNTLVLSPSASLINGSAEPRSVAKICSSDMSRLFMERLCLSRERGARMSSKLESGRLAILSI
ncbi:hypothetical protein N431DRAFT_84694 [Stipitochalara longipes BDJ]|nr:hypothetical protein N431DRAFT_84694 [Stipitochalara longipes BDJ]